VSDELLTLAQVAEITQFHVETIRRFVRQKKLPAIKISSREYRVKRSALDKWLENRKTMEEEE